MSLLDSFKKLAGNVEHTAVNSAHNIGAGIDKVVPGNQQFLHPQANQQQSQVSSPAYNPNYTKFLDAGARGAGSDLPTNLDHVIGNFIVNKAADQFGFTPAFKGLIPQANVALKGTSPDGFAGETDFGDRNSRNRQGAQINLYNDSGGNDPYIATHELLHYADSRKSPQAQAQFQSLLQNNVNPKFRGFAANVISSNYGYPIDQNTDYSNLPFNTATELHSYAPLDSSASQPLQNYYKRYFNQRAVGAYNDAMKKRKN